MTIETISKKDVSFDLLKAISKFDLEDPGLTPVQNSAQTLYTPQMSLGLGFGILGEGVLRFLANGTSSIVIDIKFQTANNGEFNRAVIMSYSSDIRTNLENANYSTPFSLYDNCGDGAAQILTSNAIFDIYSENSSIEVEQEHDCVYDIEAVLSEIRRDFPYTSYLSFDEKGNVVETMVWFSDERVYITKREGLFRDKKSEIMDITDMIIYNNSIASKEYSDLLAEIIEYNFDTE